MLREKTSAAGVGGAGCLVVLARALRWPGDFSRGRLPGILGARGATGRPIPTIIMCMSGK